MERSTEISALERAIQLNRAAKAQVPDCPCWANAAQAVDEELYKAFDDKWGDPGRRLETLVKAVRHHQELKQATPECTCWATPTRKADLDLYQALAGIQV